MAKSGAGYAYSIPTIICRYDFDSDGDVDIDDLLQVLGGFGIPIPNGSPLDTDCSGAIDTNGLLGTLGAFGETCPIL